MILSRLEIDYLKELTTICVGSVANRMATIIPFPVMISLPSLVLVSQLEQSAFFSSNSCRYSIIIHGQGDFSAQLLISLSQNTPDIIIEHNPYMAEFADTHDQSFIDSMVLEMGNILSSAYMTAVEQFTGLCLLPTVPALLHNHQDLFNHLRSAPDNSVSSQRILLQADLLLTAHRERAYFMTILTEDQVRKVLKSREVI